MEVKILRVAHGCYLELELHKMHVCDANKNDPTGTTDLRKRFNADADQRWKQMQRLTMRVLTSEDLLGVAGSRASSLADDPVQKFQAWALGVMNRIVLGNDGAWTKAYLDEAEARGRSRATSLLSHAGVDRSLTHGTIASVAISELQGVVGAVLQQATRVVATGLIAHQRLRPLAAATAGKMLTVGRTRTRTLVNYAVVRAFNGASLEAFRTLGVTHVGTIPETTIRPPLIGDAKKKKKSKPKIEMVEVLTAGDNDVCEECETISEEGPYSIDDAQDLIPAHPNCRCAFIPADDDRYANVRE